MTFLGQGPFFLPEVSSGPVTAFNVEEVGIKYGLSAGDGKLTYEPWRGGNHVQDTTIEFQAVFVPAETGAYKMQLRCASKCTPTMLTKSNSSPQNDELTKYSSRFDE